MHQKNNITKRQSSLENFQGLLGLFRYVVLCIWMFTLLTATIGLSIRSIYCYCTDSTGIAFLPAALDDVVCNEEGVRCCVGEAKKCCGTETICKADKKPCKSGKSHFEKLDLDFTIEKNVDAPHFVFNFILEKPLLFEKSSGYEQQIVSIIPNKGPPRPYGATLLPFIQTWLL